MKILNHSKWGGMCACFFSTENTILCLKLACKYHDNYMNKIANIHSDNWFLGHFKIFILYLHFCSSWL